jgi:hypothetical protein
MTDPYRWFYRPLKGHYLKVLSGKGQAFAHLKIHNWLSAVSHAEGFFRGTPVRIDKTILEGGKSRFEIRVGDQESVWGVLEMSDRLKDEDGILTLSDGRIYLYESGVLKRPDGSVVSSTTIGYRNLGLNFDIQFDLVSWREGEPEPLLLAVVSFMPIAVFGTY